MNKPLLGLAVAAALGLGLTASNIDIASAQGTVRDGQKGVAKTVVKAPTQVIVAKGPKGPGPGPVRSSSNRNRNIGIGIGAAVIGTIIATEAARANSSRSYSYSYREGDRLSCRQLERRCDDGQNWACRRLEVREDC